MQDLNVPEKKAHHLEAYEHNCVWNVPGIYFASYVKQSKLRVQNH